MWGKCNALPLLWEYKLVQLLLFLKLKVAHQLFITGTASTLKLTCIGNVTFYMGSGVAHI